MTGTKGYRASQEDYHQPAGVATLERVMNPHGLRVVGDRLIATCKPCGGVGSCGGFYCGNCNGAGVVEVRRA